MRRWKEAKARSVGAEGGSYAGLERPWGGREIGTGGLSQDEHPHEP